MNRRNFVAAVPVLAAGLTSISTLMASPLNTVSEQALMEGFDAFFKVHRSAVSSSEEATINLISTPVSKPKFNNGKLTFKVKSGETATLSHWKGQMKIHFA
jgi:hypothetical protein